MKKKNKYYKIKFNNQKHKKINYKELLNHKNY